jgi:hypothetical protein
LPGLSRLYRSLNICDGNVALNRARLFTFRVKARAGCPLVVAIILKMGIKVRVCEAL